MRLQREGAAVLATVVAAVLAGAGHAQEPPPATPVFRSSVDVVRVDVSVTASGGEAVANLQASDFDVREDGVAQRVETVQFVRLDGTRTSDAGESLAIRSPEHAALEAARDDVRVFAIFLDDYHVDKDQRTTLRVRAALKDFVRRFGPNDLVAVMDPLTPLSALTFTRSRDELLRRMDTFEGRRFQSYPVRSVMEEAQLSRPNTWELRGAVTLSALEALATYLGGLREGRKSVLFVSQGPTMGTLGLGNEDRLRAAIEAANRGNVTIHAFDPRPLGSAPMGGADVLSRLGSDTGGRIVANANDPGDRLAQTLTDASAYYLLGYTPSRALADGKFHRIDVKVKRRGVDVHARKGYWAPSAAERSVPPPTPLEPGLRAALDELVPVMTGRAVDVWVGASRAAGGLTTLTMNWERAPRAGGRGAVRVAVVPVHPGQPPPSPDAPPPDAQTIATGERASFTVPPGTRAAFKFTAQTDDGGVLDQWDWAMIAPAFTGAPVALSTPRFLRARSAFEQRALSASTDPLPAASHTFRRSDVVAVDVDCYTENGAAATITARLLNAKGASLADLPAVGRASGGTRVMVPISSLAAASYVLHIDARVGTALAQQRVAFTVE